MNGHFSRTLRIAYSSPQKIDLALLDPIHVRTLVEHRILSFFWGAPLFAWDNHLEGLYAESITCDGTGTCWNLELKKNSRFSDGQTLTGVDVKTSLIRAMRLGSGVHFNPRRDLLGGEQAINGDCEGLAVTKHGIQIKLNRSNMRFPYLLGKLEATIVRRTHAGPVIFDLKSGPYVVRSLEERRLHLEKNRSFPSARILEAPEEIELLVVETDTEGLDLLERGTSDVFYPIAPLDDISVQRAGNWVRRVDHIQTYFLSFSGNGVWGSRLDLRQGLHQRVVRFFSTGSVASRPTQLLQGIGLGRLSRTQNECGTANLRGLPVLKVAAVKNRINLQILDELEHAGLVLEPWFVERFENLFSGKALECDAFLANNDFCSHDPFVSFYNALNPDRSLIPMATEYRKELSDIQQCRSQEEKDLGYQSLQKRILSNAYAIPLMSTTSEFVLRKELVLPESIGGLIWSTI